MKTYKIQLTQEDQKKLECDLKALKKRDLQAYVQSVLNNSWLQLH